MTVSLFALISLDSTVDNMHHLLTQHGDFTVNHGGDCLPNSGGNASFNGSAAVGALALQPRRGGGDGISNDGSDDALLPNGNLNKKSVKHNSVTCHLAPHPSPSADRELKSRVFQDTCNAARLQSCTPGM